MFCGVVAATVFATVNISRANGPAKSSSLSVDKSPSALSVMTVGDPTKLTIESEKTIKINGQDIILKSKTPGEFKVSMRDGKQVIEFIQDKSKSDFSMSFGGDFNDPEFKAKMKELQKQFKFNGKMLEHDGLKISIDAEKLGADMEKSFKEFGSKFHHGNFAFGSTDGTHFEISTKDGKRILKFTPKDGKMIEIDLEKVKNKDKAELEKMEQVKKAMGLKFEFNFDENDFIAPSVKIEPHTNSEESGDTIAPESSEIRA